MKFLYLLFFILLINCKNSGKLEVYPKDIGVVIALGDSITAATHSDNIPAFESKVFYIYIINYIGYFFLNWWFI